MIQLRTLLILGAALIPTTLGAPTSRPAGVPGTTPILLTPKRGASTGTPATPAGSKDAATLLEESLSGPWPRSVKLKDDFTVTVITEETGNYIYETPHFRFISDAKLGKGLIKKLGILFEATHLANKTLPIGNIRTHDESQKFPARLFEHYDTYREAGGLPGSAGTFRGTNNPNDVGETLVPFEALGLKTMGSTYTIDRKKENSTLVHELTHQLMPFSVKQAAWFCEGSAEYMGMTDYNTGGFNFSSTKTHVIARVTGYGKKNTGGRALGTEFNAPSLEEFMNMPYNIFTGKNGNFNYGLATLIVYYFYHFDGEGDAKRIKDYIRALQKGTPEKEAQKLLLDGRTFDELTKEVTQKWRRAGVKIHFAADK